MKRVRKAIFPVAGLGTRLLPATKTMPKEMLTVVDRPLIQYAVDEAREAGIEQMIFITGRGKSSLVDYFDLSFELETVMEKAGKSLEALDVRRVTGSTILAILRDGTPITAPEGLVLAAGDQLLALGTAEQLERLERLIAASNST